MDKTSTESDRKQSPNSAANQAFFDNPTTQSHWPPPPFQLKKEEASNEEASSEGEGEIISDTPPPSNPFEKTILDSKITVHKESDKVFDEVGAKAFTVGEKIFIRNSFSVDNLKDQKVFLHEMSHALQNRSSSPSPTFHKGGFSINDDPSLEKDADSNAEKLSQKLDYRSISNIINQKARSTGSLSGETIQRKETEDEKTINTVKSKIKNIENDQKKFQEENDSKFVKPGFSFDNYDPDKSFEVRKNLQHSKLIGLLRKDIIHVVNANIGKSDQIAKESLKKHLSKSQEPLVDNANKGLDNIRTGKSNMYEPLADYGGVRLGPMAQKTKNYSSAKAQVEKGQIMLSQAKAQDPLIFIATNIGRPELLKKLESGTSDEQKKKAIGEIMNLFNEYTSETAEYVKKSPFEFQPAINELLGGNTGPTGYNWQGEGALVHSIIAQANFEAFLPSLAPDIASLILAIGAGFLSSGLSVLATGASIIAEGVSVMNTKESMDLSHASSMANASESLSVFDKATAEGKKVEFFISLAGGFLGAAVDGIEMAGKSKKLFKSFYNKNVDKLDSRNIVKISKEEYLSKFEDGDSEMAFLERTKAHNERKEAAKTAGASDEAIAKIKMSETDEKLNTELLLAVKNNKKEFARRMPASIRQAGGWKKLLEKVGDDVYIRAGMEAWRSGVYKELDDIIVKKYGVSLVRTGSQADIKAGLVDLMKASKSDMDLSIPFNKVAEARALMRNHLCKKFECNPEMLDDYLDMSIFANTPVKAIINKVGNDAIRNTMLEEQSRFEMITIYNMLYKKAQSMGKKETADILKKQMDNLRITSEELLVYNTMAKQDGLQKVIDKAMQNADKIEKQIAKNELQISDLMSSETTNSKVIQTLKKKNESLHVDLHNSYRDAMKGTTLMDISESESFWSHAGIMEVVFKQNKDFSYLVSNAYTPAQKKVMVIHDMAQLEVKLMKVEKLDASFDSIQGVGNKLLKDLSKSSSRLAQALSINAADEVTKKKFAEISARLIANKNQLSGPMSEAMVAQFKNELQKDLIQIDSLCKKQISDMVDSSMVSKYGNQKMITEFQGDINEKIMNQQASEMIHRVLTKMGRKSTFLANDIQSITSETHSGQDGVNPVKIKADISTSKSAVLSGNSASAIEILMSIGNLLKRSGQDLSDMKFDLLSKNLKSQFLYLKKKSGVQGGLFKNDDIKRVDFVKARIRKLSYHIHKSSLSEDQKTEVSSTISQLQVNLENLITPPLPVQIDNKPKKRNVRKRFITPTIVSKPKYPSKDHTNYLHSQREKGHLKTHTGKVPMSVKTIYGKTIIIKQGEQYYQNEYNKYLGKKE